MMHGAQALEHGAGINRRGLAEVFVARLDPDTGCFPPDLEQMAQERTPQRHTAWVSDLGAILENSNGGNRPLTAVRWSHSQWPLADQKAAVRTTRGGQPARPLPRPPRRSAPAPGPPTCGGAFLYRSR